MSDLIGNHTVGFPTRRLRLTCAGAVRFPQFSVFFLLLFFFAITAVGVVPCGSLPSGHMTSE